MVDPDPESLANGAGRGDEAAAWQLLDEHLPLARAVIRRRMGKKLRSKEESLDVLQSVCRTVLAQPDTLAQRQSGSFRRWLIRVIDTKVVDRLRKQSPAVMGGQEDEPDPAAAAPSTELSPSKHAIGRETAEAVRAALQQLPEHTARLLKMHELEGVSYEEIGRREGLTLKQARWQVGQARLALGRLLRGLQDELP